MDKVDLGRGTSMVMTRDNVELIKPKNGMFKITCINAQVVWESLNMPLDRTLPEGERSFIPLPQELAEWFVFQTTKGGHPHVGYTKVARRERGYRYVQHHFILIVYYVNDMLCST